VFRLLADPRNHARLDGSGLLRGDPGRTGPVEARRHLHDGDEPGRQGIPQYERGGEFEPDRRIAWQSTGRKWRGHSLVGGQRWRYILQPNPAGTLVEHAYVWGYAHMPLLTIWLPGFPRRMRPVMERSLANLAMLAVEREHHELLTTTVGENRS